MRGVPSSPPLALEASLTAANRCPRCGGSGLLRQGDRRYRTCLDCLGQGRLLTQESVPLQLGGLSVAVSVSAAR
jgi:DnaJ-class molecular chaperone